MNKRIPALAALLTLPLFMGIAMPSCPGQEDLQQKLATSQQEMTQLKARTQQLAQELQLVKEDYIRTKKLVEEIGTTVLAQKTVLEQLDAQTKALNAALEKKPAARSAPAPATKKRR
jgi:hypothetical protein